MSTKADIIERIRVYNTTGKGFFRTWFGGKPAVDWLSAILELPHIAALEDSAEFSFPRLLAELDRLGVNYTDIYTTAFLTGTSESSILFQTLFPTALTDMATPPAALAREVISPPSSVDVENTLKLLRDQLLFYCACITKKPAIQSFFGGFIGVSGGAGLHRARLYLPTVNQAIINYTARGVLEPSLLLTARQMHFGPTTRNIVESTLSKLMDIIHQLLHIKATFTSMGRSGTYHGEEIWMSKTAINIIITNPLTRKPYQLQGNVECYASRKEFDDFLEGYMSEKGISLTHPTPTTTFNPELFLTAFQAHLDELVANEDLRRAAAAAGKVQEQQASIEAGIAGLM